MFVRRSLYDELPGYLAEAFIVLMEIDPLIVQKDRYLRLKFANYITVILPKIQISIQLLKKIKKLLEYKTYIKYSTRLIPLNLF